MRIFKYELELIDIQDVYLPEGARPLHVGAQRGRLCLWCMVDPFAPTSRKTIFVYGTGHQLLEDVGEYLGTAQLYDLVLHVFWRL